MNSIFNDPGFWHRLQFGFTIVYHYLFPQLTMGLAWFLVYWKWRALRTGDEKYNQAVRFWAKIFGLNFAVGVVTGIPMELGGLFQICRRGDWPDAGDGRDVRVLPGERVRRRIDLG
jgi:Cytochrome bd terminal oxidase subunit I